jgi:NADH:ubiquinone oxidoreductase subunit C
MKKKHLVPLQLFIILEHIKLKLFFSKNNFSPILYIISLSSNIIKFSQILKFELLLCNSYLLDYSAYECNNNRVTMFYILMYYNYTYDWRLALLCHEGENVNSISHIWQNANWLEREVTEMYCARISNILDTRNLLLNYTFTDHPMLKNIKLQGYNDTYYSVFVEQTRSAKTYTSEL